MITAREVITQVNRSLGKIPIPGETTLEDSDAVESVTEVFSDVNLLQRINRSQQALAADVKLQHLPGLWETKFEGANGIFDVAMVRPLFSRVFRDKSGTGAGDWVRCKRRSSASSKRLEATGLKASDEYPVFIYTDGRLTVLPEGNQVKFFYVPVPARLDKDDIVDGGAGDSDTAFTDELIVHRYLKRAIVAYTLGTCYQTLRVPGLKSWAMQQYEMAVAPFTTDKRQSPIWDDREIDLL